MLKLDKRITLSVAGVLALGAITAIIGTTAFFKDTKSTTNTFTVGNVKIALTEQQRAKDNEGNYTTTLEDFTQAKTLLPLVGSEGASGYDSVNMPLAKNYGDKIVTVDNTGATDAYIRAYVAIPKILDDAVNASNNILHFNFGLNSNNQKTSEAGSGDWLWKTNNAWNYSTQTISTKPLDTTSTATTDIEYAVYYADYKEAVPANGTTARLLNGVYLDSNITDIKKDTTDNTTEICFDSNCIDINYDADTYGFQIPVYIVAVQADGFANATEAFNQALPANFTPDFQ